MITGSTMKKTIKKHKIKAEEDLEKRGLLAHRLIEHITNIVDEDFGDEPEEFDEEDDRSQVWRAVRVLQDYYKQEIIDD
jgi:hypothetical protein